MRVRAVGKTGYYVDFTEEIERGVAVLDGHDPRWFDKVNLDMLMLDNPDHCVLGQLAMESFQDDLDKYFDLSEYHYNYYKVVEWLSDLDETDESGEDFGFSFSHSKLHYAMRGAGIPSLNPDDAPRRANFYEDINRFYARVWEQLTEQWAVQIEKCRADAGTMTGGDR